MELVAIEHVTYPPARVLCPHHETIITVEGGGEFLPEETITYLLYKEIHVEEVAGIMGTVEVKKTTYHVHELYEEMPAGYIAYAPMTAPGLRGAFPALAECL